jgi:hypothetical protein
MAKQDESKKSVIVNLMKGKREVLKVFIEHCHPSKRVPLI